jgi:hypothetical protein
LAVVFAWEALQVAFASAEQPAEYRFGSEAVLCHGGPHCRSQVVYVLSGPAAAAALFSLSGLLAVVSRQPSRWFWSSVVPFGLALAAGAAMMLAAWEHNPQGEIHSEAGVAWLHWFSIGTSWFVLFYAVGLPLAWLGVFAASHLRARPDKRLQVTATAGTVRRPCPVAVGSGGRTAGVRSLLR